MHVISLVHFSIENDPYLGYVISGEYDFGNGDWNNDYIVTDLLESRFHDLDCKR